jgi:hypothetical protein
MQYVRILVENIKKIMLLVTSSRIKIIFLPFFTAILIYEKWFLCAVTQPSLEIHHFQTLERL